MTTVIELIAKLNRQASQGLARNIKAMPEDKVSWHPMDVGRDAIDQAIECAGIYFLAAKSLTTRENPVFDPAAFEAMKTENDTTEKVLALLEKGTDTFVAAVEAFPPEHLDDKVTLPFGGGMEMTFADMMLLAHWNTVYHVGQVTYIQTLYGDKEMH